MPNKQEQGSQQCPEPPTGSGVRGTRELGRG